MSGKLVAIEIRKELKAKYPNIKFSVTSDYDSVRIKYNFGVSTKQIESLCGKYEMGYYDGQEECYKNSNRNNSIPQCKYVFIDRNKTWDVKKSVVEYICQKFNLDMNNRHEIEGYSYLSVINDIEIIEDEAVEITFKRIQDEAVKQHRLVIYESNVTQDVTESVTQNVTESVTQDVTQDITESVIESVTQDVIESVIEIVTQNVIEDLTISNIENSIKIVIPKSDTRIYRDVLLKKLEQQNDIDSSYYYDIICYSKGGNIVKSDDTFEACYNIMEFLSLIEFNDNKYLMDGYREMSKIGIKFEKSDLLYIDTGYKKLILFKDNICYII